MSRYRRASAAGATYFFTVVTYRRQRILCDERVRYVKRCAMQLKLYVSRGLLPSMLGYCYRTICAASGPYLTMTSISPLAG